MANDDALALYGAAKASADSVATTHKVLIAQMAQMDAQTAALHEKVTALGVVIAELKQLPRALGQQTSQYIAQGVKQAIQDDFSRPIADAVSGPMGQLDYTAREARSAIAAIRHESKLQSWRWLALIALLGIVVGIFGSYFFYNRQLDKVSDQLDHIQQQITPPAPAAVEVKPTDGKLLKGKKGH